MDSFCAMIPPLLSFDDRKLRHEEQLSNRLETVEQDAIAAFYGRMRCSGRAEFYIKANAPAFRRAQISFLFSVMKNVRGVDIRCNDPRMERSV